MLKDIELLSKMDPYCEVYAYEGKNPPKQSYERRIYRTQVKDNAGKTPVWNE